MTSRSFIMKGILLALSVIVMTPLACNSKEQLRQAQSQLNEVQRQLSSQEDETSRVSLALQEERTRGTQLGSDVAGLKEQLSSAGSRVSGAESKLSVAKDGLSLAQSRASDLRAQLSGIRTDLSSFQGQVANSETQVSGLKQQLDDVGSRLTSVQSALGDRPRQLTADDIARRVIPAVVRISGSGTSTGFIIDKEGHILTNAHTPVGNFKVIPLTGDPYPALLLGIDEVRDLAIIQGEPTDVFLPLGDSDGLAMGEDIWAIGYPLGSALRTQPSVTRGVLSAKRQMAGLDLLQMDTPLYHGNSGGPVLNNRGEVIGVNSPEFVVGLVKLLTGGASVDSIGFAHAINPVKSVLPALISEETIMSPVQLVEYENAVWNFSINVPAGWSLSELENGDVVLNSPSRSVTFNIAASKQSNYSLEQWTDSVIQPWHSKMPWEVELSRTKIALSGSIPAYLVMFKGTATVYSRDRELILTTIGAGRCFQIKAYYTLGYNRDVYGAQVDEIMRSFALN